MLGIGIIGAGYFGEDHAKAIAEVDQLQLVASCRLNPEKLQEFVGKYGGKPYTQHQDLLADPSVDAVVIATPHHLHTHIAEDAARAKKHILLEKPMAPTLEECDHIVSIVKEQGVTLMLGHVSHFIPAYRKAKDILESGELGKVVLGSSTISKFWYEPNRRDWHLDRATGGGMWMSVGMHALDRLTWLMDSPIARVSAQLDTRFHDQQADDTGLIFLRYANGSVGTVVSVGYKDGAPKFDTELTCTRGILHIKGNDVIVGQNGEWHTVSAYDAGSAMHDGLVNEWLAFSDAITQGSQPAVTGDYARHIMATVIAAEESSIRHEEVDVDPPRHWKQ